MVQDESDRALVVAARNGDKSAFSALFQRHRPMLQALCLRAVGDAFLADDIVQDAAIQAMLNLDRLRNPQRFGSWLGGIGLNLCRRWLRERSRPLRADWSLDVLAGGRWASEPAATEADPQDLAEEADLARRVRSAVANLPRGQRASVMLFYLAGLTYAETAAQLGIEIGAVKTRLNKARRALRRDLAELWKETIVEKTIDYEQAVPVRLADVRRRVAEGDKPEQFVLMLEEIDGARRLPIWVGKSEAIQAAIQLEKVQVPRPATYAFAASLLQAVGGRLSEVVITKLDEADTFYAVAVVESSRKQGIVDARPSDAINLALIMGAPIRVDPAVFAANEASALAKQPEECPSLEGTQGVKDIVAEVEATWRWPAAPVREER
jgi:RNA polymerase sigma-70 factor (ECF subfamily)